MHLHLWLALGLLARHHLGSSLGPALSLRTCLKVIAKVQKQELSKDCTLIL